MVDKSFLQLLNADETRALNHHYCVFIAPVLLQEILGNLIKTDFAPDEVLSRVIALAAKADGISSYVMHDARVMMMADLLHHRVRLQPGAPRYGSKEVVKPDGTKAVILKATEEENLLRRWKSGTFTEQDRQLAIQHSNELEEYDLPGSQKEMQELYPENMKVKSFEEIAASFDERGVTDDLEWTKIKAAAMYIPLSDEELAKLRARWDTEGRPDFKNFAAYANYCSRIFAIYFLGVTAELVNTNKKQKTLIDVIYFFYLPFVQIFCSGDKFHRDHFKFFARGDQKFIWGPDLKEDLRQLVSYRKELKTEDRLKFDKEFGNRPPYILNSITRDMWERYCDPWKPGSGNQAIGMSADEYKATLDSIKSLFDESKKNR